MDRAGDPDRRRCVRLDLRNTRSGCRREPTRCSVGIRACLMSDLRAERRRREFIDDAVRTLFPESQDATGDIVRVTFWNWSGDDGVHRTARRIAVPTWSAIRENYHSSTRTDLDALVGRVPTDASGKLILWHGAPGTGKTWAIRALLSEWRSWATGHYILDPERFFGQSATYMMSVLMDHDRIAMDRDGQEDGDRWRLLIVEDAGELLGKDARLQSGQGLARLLNVCDGLVGQGLRVLILLTTNEEVG